MDNYTIRTDARKLISRRRATFEVVSRIGVFEQTETDEMLVMKRVRMLYAMDLIQEIRKKPISTLDFGKAMHLAVMENRLPEDPELRDAIVALMEELKAN